MPRLLILLLLSVTLQPATAQVEICPDVGIQPRGADFTPGGIVLTAFDSTGLWVYDIDRNSRYPLPETAPCGHNCHLSPDAEWITYYDAVSGAVYKMRLNGTQRTPLAADAAEIRWWDAETLLLWTTTNHAYLQVDDGALPPQRERLITAGASNVQPGGYNALLLDQVEDQFERLLVDLNQPEAAVISLGWDRRYFNAAAWAPDGGWLAFTAPLETDGQPSAELFGIRPGSAEVIQWTDFSAGGQAVRINGHAPRELSWSPDGTRLAFWVIGLTGPDPETDTTEAALYLFDVTTNQLARYCGFTTTEHTPNPPRLVWSPDGTHIAFAGNVPGDDKGYLLLALNTESGVLTELSNGVFPAFGRADVTAWGRLP